MGNGECQIRFEKKIFRPFFCENWPEKNGKKLTQHAAQLNGDPSIKAKTLPFPSFLHRQYSKIYPLHSKKSEN